MRTLLKQGKIYDGTGADAFTGDVLLDGDRIAQVAPSIDAQAVSADQVIDLDGLSVAPGFIDAHSHNDWFAIRRDPLPFFEPFIRQGITTFVTGNCGISETGFEAGCAHIDLMGAGLFHFEDTTGQYGSMKDFFAAIDGHCPCNIAALVGHCSARAAVSGSVNRPLTDEEMAQMLAILERNLQQGAAGISLGLMYDPGLYADVAEMKQVAALCVKYGKPLTVHPRAESKVSMAYPQLLGRSHLLRAFDELVDISRGTNLKLQYSHAIFVGKNSFRDKAELLRMIHQLRAEGVDVMFDIYNECLGVSVITVILPDWYRELTQAQKKSPLNRLKLRALVAASSLLLGFGFKDIEIAYIGPGYEKYEGKTVTQIAAEEHMSAFDAYLMLCEVSGFKGRVNMGPYSTPEIISEFEQNDLCLFMTDAWVEKHGVQNPAIYDCFPKFLRDALRGTGAPLPMTIRKMTGATADRFQLKDRGYLKAGYYADVTVFNEQALRDATPDQKQSFGIEQVYINGRQVLQGDDLNAEALKTAGRAVPV